MSKIVLLSTRYDIGGASLLATKIASQLRDRGHNAEAWCLYFQCERHAQPAEWVRVLLPHPPRGFGDLARMTNALGSAMRSFRPDAFFGVQPLANILGALTAALAGCPRRYGGQHNPADSQRRVLRNLEKLVGTYVYTGNVAVSEAVRDTYLAYPSMYRSKLKVIHNGIPSRGDKYAKLEARDRFGLPRDCFLVGTVGQHDTDQKHHGFLVDLLPVLPDVHLVIAGHGRLHGQLQEKIVAHGLTDRAHLLGSIPQKSVECFLDCLDVFLLPSRFEGFSLALLEAMQSGLPIVGNDITMIREALETAGQSFGFLISTEQPEKWRDAILALKDEPASRELWSQRASDGVRRFSFETMVGEYERAAGEGLGGGVPCG